MSTATDGPITLDALNRLPATEFVATLGPVFENAQWIAQQAAAGSPFASVTALHAAMMAALQASVEDAIVGFLRGHPALSSETLRRGTTAESTAEQRSAGLHALEAATSTRIDAAMAEYDARFGFPFILAIRGASSATILAAAERRLGASRAAELAEAVREVGAISWMRLLERVRPAPTGGLSTHVLDTARACPAAGLQAELWSHPASAPAFLVATIVTDARGRSGVLLGDGALRAGSYEWRFDTASYFARQGAATPDRGFLPVAVVRFSVWNPEEHFHVPLLLTPGSYTTYRGS